MAAENHSLLRKVLQMILLINGIVLLLTCMVFFAYDYVTFREARVRELTAISNIITANATAALVFHDADAAQEVLHALEAERKITAACLYDADNLRFAGYPEHAELPVAPGAEGFVFAVNTLESFRPIMQSGKQVGVLYLRCSMDALYDRMKMYVVLAVVILSLTSLLAWSLYQGLKKKISNPLRELADTTAALESANKELESFSYSVSHDLRAPLRSIHGYVNILHEEYGPTLDAEGKRLIDIILRNGQKMGQLIDDLLAFSQLGRKELSKSTIDMNDMVNSIIEEQKRTPVGERTAFKTHTLPVAYGDNATLRQVWINLIANAVKYSRQKEHPAIEIGSVIRDGRTAYYVRDNGAGFDMKYYDKLFGVFQRLHSTKEFEGTGVGLAIVQRIVSRHGGKIWATGQVNEGATFYFTLS